MTIVQPLTLHLRGINGNEIVIINEAYPHFSEWSPLLISALELRTEDNHVDCAVWLTVPIVGGNVGTKIKHICWMNGSAECLVLNAKDPRLIPMSEGLYRLYEKQHTSHTKTQGQPPQSNTGTNSHQPTEGTSCHWPGHAKYDVTLYTDVNTHTYI